MGERQFGPYRLVRQIAVGGMAEIHLAKTKGIAGFEKYVALKMIHPNFAEDEQFIQMLVDEAKIAVQLTHGNIAQTFDLGRVGDTYYITMEYVDGADLYKILRRGSEQDLEMPLDVCAFVAKEVASALDHAHRKRDHAGKALGIVHRDVSPQNVLVSYSGEVKLVDFGIAKATMKARQTAVGVIKGKYYYMSPEQAWGDSIDFRSDIFSAGIVLYEMITGQMLYLEEDLHKLLDMARKADIAPPSKLRRGVPPQLEKIVMHALAKQPGDRYQSAGDFASDLERFLHAYSPVFTAAKLSGLIRQVLGDPAAPADDFDIEVREGVNATHTLDITDLKEELRDENSVIFRVADLNKPASVVSAPIAAKPAPIKAVNTRAHAPTEPPEAPGVPPRGAVGAPLKIPSVARAHSPTRPQPPSGSPPVASPQPPVPAKPQMPAAGTPRPASQPRQKHEETKEIAPAPPAPGMHDDTSGLLIPSTGAKVSARKWDASDTHPGDGSGADDLENIGERTMITSPSGAGFMLEDDGIEHTMVNAAPPTADDPDTSDEPADHDDDHGGDDDDGPTIARDFRTDQPRKPGKAPPPAALAANIHAPAVSELRKPRPSKRTPQGGVPVQPPNVLQQMIAKQASEPMPVPVARPEPAPPQTYSAPAAYATDASGMPIGLPTPPGLPAAPPVPGVPAHLQPYAHAQGQGAPPAGYPPQAYGYPPQPQAYPGYPQAQPQSPSGYPGYPQAPQSYPQAPPGYAPEQPQVSPGALYQFQPAPQPMSLTGQLRLFEVDEMPSQYKLGAARRRWFAYIVAGLLAVSVAAGVTFFIIRSTRESAPTVAAVHITSVPSGAEVTFDGTRLADKTPLTVDSVPVGTLHTVKLELPRHQIWEDTNVAIPNSGGEVAVSATLKPLTGKLRIVTTPDGAEILLNGTIRGRTPATITDVDLGQEHLELRLKDYQPYVQELSWPANGSVDLDIKLKR